MSKKVEVTLKDFKVLLCDADGVFFTGYENRVVIDGSSRVMKTRHHHDGQGISFLRGMGIKVLFVTGEGEPMNSIVEKLNQLPSAKDGTFSTVEIFSDISAEKTTKEEKIDMWLKENGYEWEDCVYIGDDANDFNAMQKAAVGIAPHDATRMIKKVADHILDAKGGEGAIREFTEMVLDARGVKEANLPNS